MIIEVPAGPVKPTLPEPGLLQKFEMDRIKYKRDLLPSEEVRLPAGHQAHPLEGLFLLNRETQVPKWTEIKHLNGLNRRYIIVVHGQINHPIDHIPELRKANSGPLLIRIFNDQIKDQQGIQISKDLRGVQMLVDLQEVVTSRDLQEALVFKDPPEAQRRVVCLVVLPLSDQVEIPV